MSERVVNQLLTELDGVENRGSVYVIAATNRPDIIDRAMLRPGRLDKLLYVPLPTEADRLAILKTQCRNLPLAPDVDLDRVSRDPRCVNFSGADCNALVREARLNAILPDLLKLEHCEHTPATQTRKLISFANFDFALSKLKPSVPLRDLEMYEKLKLNLHS